MVASVNVEWPQALLSPFTAVSWLFAASQTSTGLDCLLAGSHSKLPLPIQKVRASGQLLKTQVYARFFVLKCLCRLFVVFSDAPQACSVC